MWIVGGSGASQKFHDYKYHYIFILFTKEPKFEFFLHNQSNLLYCDSLLKPLYLIHINLYHLPSPILTRHFLLFKRLLNHPTLTSPKHFQNFRGKLLNPTTCLFFFFFLIIQICNNGRGEFKVLNHGHLDWKYQKMPIELQGSRTWLVLNAPFTSMNKTMFSILNKVTQFVPIFCMTFIKQYIKITFPSFLILLPLLKLFDLHL